MYSNNSYNKNLKVNARKLRKNMTFTEKVVWHKILRNRQMLGHKFLRQRPILNYIVDFVCLELKLVIEIDGSSHDLESVQKNDIIRQNRLEKEGFRFLRFRDREILSNLDSVRFTIETFITENHPPSSSLEGGKTPSPANTKI